MFGNSKSDSGQISILVLAVSIALLATTSFIGMIAEALVAQQRLNSKAEAIALAGARELEFNQTQACEVAKDFGHRNFEVVGECLIYEASIEISLLEPNPSRILGTFIPNIQATSRAGITGGN